MTKIKFDLFRIYIRDSDPLGRHCGAVLGGWI